MKFVRVGDGLETSEIDFVLRKTNRGGSTSVNPENDGISMANDHCQS